MRRDDENRVEGESLLLPQRRSREEGDRLRSSYAEWRESGQYLSMDVVSVRGARHIASPKVLRRILVVAVGIGLLLVRIFC